MNTNDLKALKPKKEMYAVTVLPGLQLRIWPSGKKVWHVTKSIAGRRLVKDLGTFPEITFAEVKEYMISLVQGKSGNTLNDIYKDWMALKTQQVIHAHSISLRFEKYILPEFGHKEFSRLTPPELIKHLKAKLEAHGKYETLQRICLWFKQLERFAVNSGRAESLRFQGISEVFPTAKPTHRKSVAYEDLKDFLPELRREAYKTPVTWNVLLMLFYTLLRPGECCAMQWSWIKQDRITIPAEVMKMKKEHFVPVTPQIASFLAQLPRINDYVFPSPDKENSHVGIDSLGRFLKRHGLNQYMTPHGIRSTGRTWMQDHDIPDIIGEMCLAHVAGSATFRAYSRSEMFDLRLDAMKRWNEFVEQCL